MDYDKLLDEWAEHVFKAMDNATERMNNQEFGTPKFYTNSGYADGLAMAITLLHKVEKKYKINLTK